LFITILFVYHEYSYNSIEIAKENAVPAIWVSMSLCWSENVKIHRKSKFPYILASQLSAKLWKNVTEGELKVILTVVYNEDVDMDDLENYVKSFENEEGVVIVLEKTTSLGCVLQSQLSRMFAFKNKFVNAEDIIITSDVDIFVMDKRIIQPLKMPFTTWIY
jgi:hypothetical protein